LLATQVRFAHLLRSQGDNCLVKNMFLINLNVIRCKSTEEERNVKKN
jgi:hypothetical protein